MGLIVQNIAALAVCPTQVKNTKHPASFSRTCFSADRVLALDLRVLGFSIVSISAVVVLRACQPVLRLLWLGSESKSNVSHCSAPCSALPGNKLAFCEVPILFFT